MSTFWDERFGAKEFIYGKKPNEFFKAIIDKLKPGRILVPAAGEGRDAVYAATKGWQVDAFDQSIKGKEKALLLAKEFSAAINYEIMDAAQYKARKYLYDAIGLSYFHLPPALRASFHHELIESLKPGGTVFIEAFNPKQLNNTSGGPKELSLLFTPEMLEKDFAGLTIIQNEELVTQLNEGAFHKGKADVIRFIGTKP